MSEAIAVGDTVKYKDGMQMTVERLAEHVDGPHAICSCQLVPGKLVQRGDYRIADLVKVDGPKAAPAAVEAPAEAAKGTT